MKNILILHSSARLRLWLADLCRGNGGFNEISTAGSLDIAISKFDHFQNNILIIEDRFLDSRSRSWIVDRRHRLDEHLLLIHSVERERQQKSAFTLPLSHSNQDLDRYASELLARLQALSTSPPVYNARVKTPRQDYRSTARTEIVVKEKIHPDKVLPYRNLVRPSDRSWVIVIGASTGGTEAIKRIVGDMSEGHPPVVIVQHMPENFMAPFAGHLAHRTGKDILLAEDGAIAGRDRFYLIPGGVQGTVERSVADLVQLGLLQGPAVSRHCPSVNILFRSAAMNFGPRCIAVLLTGMGDDGVIGIGEVKAAGGYCIIQDEESSVIFGMPGEAKKRGFYSEECSLRDIAGRLDVLSRNIKAAV